MKLSVIGRDGSETILDASPDRSVMENIRNAGIAELAALCGGSCSCATCHVYVRTEHALPPMSVDEDGLLDGINDRRPTSRLSCQIPFTAALDGLQVEIGPEE